MFDTGFLFLPTNKNSHIFLAQFSPKVSSASELRNAVIFIPPFGEEMNRSKRMYILCARLLANNGCHSFCFDLSGTGDSEGVWGEFDYSDWLENLKDVIDFVQAKNFQKITFVSLRFGALIALDALSSVDVPIEKCIFWDPVDNGEVYMRQLIRMKIAASMAENSVKITTKDILEEFNSKGSVEIGGYQISNEIFKHVSQLKFVNTIDAAIEKTSMHWMQTGRTEGRAKKTFPLSINKEWAQQIVFHDVDDVRFWMQQETTISPELLRQTQLLING